MKKIFTKTLFLAFLGLWLMPEIALSQSFINPLPIPYLVNDTDNEPGFDTIRLVMEEKMHRFNPNDPSHYLYDPVKVYAFNEVGVGTDTALTILGPTIQWNFHAKVHTEVTNRIDSVTTTHWHGAHVPHYADGGPHQKIYPDSTWKIDFEVLDSSATMWYHPHAKDITWPQTQLGLSGMLYVQDPPDGVGDAPILTNIHHTLPTKYGVDDFPIIFQTKQFLEENDSFYIDPNIIYSPTSDFEYITNGVVYPYLEVPANIVRLRLLNGDGQFTWNLSVVDADTVPIMDCHLVATDAGYTDSSYQVTNVRMAPGERTEWLLDFRNYTVGDRFFLHSVLTRNINKKINFLEIRIVENTLPQSPIGSFPIALSPFLPPETFPWTKKRHKIFRRDSVSENCMGPKTHSNRFIIDSALMHIDCVNDIIMLDSTEIWTIENQTGASHPFHIHQTHFWVVDGWETDASGITTPIDKSKWPNIFKGPKDNVDVLANWTLVFVAQFKRFGTTIEPENSYMFHCHILPHEDAGMMGQFVVWDPTLTSTDDTEISLNQTEPPVIYPNPAEGILNLEGFSQSESYIRIFNIQGQLLKKHTLPPFEGSINFSIDDLPRGFIFVEWITERGRFVNKVILQ